MGIKAYDLVSGRQILKPSYLLSKRKALELFPMLKKDKLKAALVYYDGKSKQYLQVGLRKFGKKQNLLLKKNKRRKCKRDGGGR